MTGEQDGNTAAMPAAAGGAPLDFRVTINPCGPPGWLRSVLSRAVEELGENPDPDCDRLRAACSSAWRRPASGILPGQSASEIIQLLPRAFRSGRVLSSAPSLSEYDRAARAARISMLVLPAGPDGGVDLDRLALACRPGDLVFLGHPSHPAGRLLERGPVTEMAALQPRACFVIDERSIDFVAGVPSFLDDGDELPANLLVLRSFTEFYAMPGLGLACLVAAAERIAALREQQGAGSVNVLARSVGVRALTDENFARRTRYEVRKLRRALRNDIAALPGLAVSEGAANQLLIRRTDGGSVRELSQALSDDFGLVVGAGNGRAGPEPEFLYMALRCRRENQRLVAALRSLLGERSAGERVAPGRARPVRRARPLMIQGIASNAGKSLLTAAFCRILLQDGLRVAPFKAQNISLNSFVTARGAEVARAQAVQAAACRLDPDVRMSPVLLKPGGAEGSQAIIAGKPAGSLSSLDPRAYRRRARAEARSSYDSLSAEFDAIVLEGAGSPGEVNLKAADIANMQMARYAEAPVLLAGDIDRGGVFASFVGTMEVLDEWERRLVAGFLVNRMRGDAGLLGSALDYMQERCGRPVLGVIPYLSDPGLPEEDSVGFQDRASFFALGAAEHHAAGENRQAGAAGDADATPGPIEIALIDLPFLSNFTDFEPLAREPDVRLRVVRRGDALGRPDLVLLPGTKNSLHDLDYLVDSGLAAAIRSLAQSGTSTIVGLCGGMQMLGRSLHDPERIESGAGRRAGLGLLDLETTLAPEKTLRQVRARHLPSGLTVRGYEIHHGRTLAPAELTIMYVDGEVGGVADDEGRVWGTYLHGVFDDDEFRRWFVDSLRERRGLPAMGVVQTRYDLEPAFERLAAEVRASVDMDRIYRLMGL